MRAPLILPKKRTIHYYYIHSIAVSTSDEAMIKLESSDD